MLMKSFAQMCSTSTEGLVFLGCANPESWVSGINDLWSKEGQISPDWFGTPYLLTTSGGRIDLVFPFSPACNTMIDIGKLAIWRLRFGDCSWISDYKVNYTNQHVVEEVVEEVVDAQHVEEVDAMLEQPQTETPPSQQPKPRRPIARMAPMGSKGVGKPSRRTRSTRKRKVPVRYH